MAELCGASTAEKDQRGDIGQHIQTEYGIWVSFSFCISRKRPTFPSKLISTLKPWQSGPGTFKTSNVKTPKKVFCFK